MIVPDPLPDGTRLADLQAAIQVAWMAKSYDTVASMLKRYNLFDWMCPCCAQVRAAQFRSANAAHRDNVLVRVCDSCKVARQR